MMATGMLPLGACTVDRDGLRTDGDRSAGTLGRVDYTHRSTTSAISCPASGPAHCPEVPAPSRPQCHRLCARHDRGAHRPVLLLSRLARRTGDPLRLGIGRDGFGWKGQAIVGAKKAWPDWRPPREMIDRLPNCRSFPATMAACPRTGNPIGARALYLYQNGRDTLYGSTGPRKPNRSVRRSRRDA